MAIYVAIALSFVLLPVLVAGLVSLAASGATRAGVRIPRVMREGPWPQADERASAPRERGGGMTLV